MRNVRKIACTLVTASIVGIILFQYAAIFWEGSSIASQGDNPMAIYANALTPDRAENGNENPNTELLSAGVIGPLSESISMLLLGIALIQLGGLGRKYLKK